ncbi:hypothetical protein V8J36_11630 [Frigidibacter sp. MR17.14]|uniref:hypothetical protein n=1 Tax=Frigidibacter sp. MR17.14 TaxID=3126509 RepID=UPI003012DED8
MVSALRLHLTLYLRRLLAAAALVGLGLAAPQAPNAAQDGPEKLDRPVMVALAAPVRAAALKAEPLGGAQPKSVLPPSPGGPRPPLREATATPAAPPAPSRPRPATAPGLARAPPTLS